MPQPHEAVHEREQVLMGPAHIFFYSQCKEVYPHTHLACDESYLPRDKFGKILELFTLLLRIFDLLPYLQKIARCAVLEKRCDETRQCLIINTRCKLR